MRLVFSFKHFTVIIKIIFVTDISIYFVTSEINFNYQLLILHYILLVKQIIFKLLN